MKKENKPIKTEFCALSDQNLSAVSGGANTDEDRASIQKEIDQSIAQIDDNALL